jgi:diguanylate cyclase (GGDEF)-like protein
LDFQSFIRSSESAPELILGLFALVVLLNFYLFHERRVIRGVRRELLRQLIIVERSAQIDPLTGAFNRRCLDQLLRKEISRAIRKKIKLSLMVIDVNDFKGFNSRFGHLFGDEILTQVAAVLSSALRASDTIIRYGGDEFIVILSDTDHNQADNAVQRIHEYLSSWNARANNEVQVSVTCGISEFADGMSGAKLIELADKAMFLKKRAVPKTV